MSEAAQLEQAEAGTSLWQDAWHRLCKNKLAMVSVVVLTLVVVIAVTGPWFSSYSYEDQDRALWDRAAIADIMTVGPR